MKKVFVQLSVLCSLAFAVSVSLSLIGAVQAAPSINKVKSQHQFAVENLLGAVPNWKAAQKISSSGVTPNVSLPLPFCVTNPTPTVANPGCYDPKELQTAYGVNGLLKAGITGKGRTIVIVDSSSSPTLQSDLHFYDGIFGLKDPNLSIFTPFGTPPVNLNVYPETALDVETAHALAPDASIDLILTGDTMNDTTTESFFYDLLKPVKYAIDHNLGSTISISYGVGESCFDTAYLQYEHTIFQSARDKGISVFVSAGDSGAAISSCTSPTTTTGFFYGKGVSIPAADPLVSSVGGTSLKVKVGSGAYESETTWNEDSNGFGATGGGFSSVFPTPDYQKGVPTIGRMRGLPDISWDADPLTGVEVVLSTPSGTEIVPIGGTSAGAPAWAGMDALFNQYAGTQRLGFLNEAFYRILKSSSYAKGFHDIQTGNNSVSELDANGNPFPVAGYNAGPGWDAVTGVGTPKAGALAPLLKQYVQKGDGTGL